jgi:hypothetical protein
MYKLILKVEECKRSAEGFNFTCKDKFDIEYMFKSKCFKPTDTYIQVSFNKYSLVTETLASAEQIWLLDIKHIDQLEVLDNKLMLNGKQVKCNILKEVQEYITRYTVEELNKLIKECIIGIDYSDHLDVMRRYQSGKIKYEYELKRLKRYLKIA